MTTQEILKKYIAENSLEGIELTSFDVDEMLDQWLDENPMPVGDADDFQFCISKAMWLLCQAEARAIFYGKEFPLDVPKYRWNIERAIINRDSLKSMLSAALDYANSKCEQADSIIFENDD